MKDRWAIFRKPLSLSSDELRDLSEFLDKQNSEEAVGPGTYELNTYSYLMVEVDEDGDVEVL